MSEVTHILHQTSHPSAVSSHSLTANMSSPWGKAPVVVAPCSLEDVMSEQLASELSNQPDDDLGKALLASKQAVEAIKHSEAAAIETPELSDAELAAKLAAQEAGENLDDELIARYLQKQYDEEYDAMVANKEKKYNGTSKVSVSFENYKMKTQRQLQGQELFTKEEEDSDYEEDYPDLPTKTNWEAGKPSLGQKGYAGQGKNIITKHDRVQCGRRNAERLMEMPPGFLIGDGEGMDMQLPNRVYNKLKTHTMAENKKSHKVHEKKDHSTAIKAVDEKTRILMFKLINSGYLAAIHGVVSEGKEAVVFNAAGGLTQDDKPLPPNIILKVMKTTMKEFTNRAKYVYGDHILSKDKFKKQNPRKVMKIWAEKEFLNLKRMRRHKIPCPIPLTLKHHILVMSCIGGETPAPKLKDARLSPQDYEDAYDQTVKVMKCLYHECGLVHADLSAYNLLWYKDTVWVIDVSQAVERTNSNSHDFLLRDCQNICEFFKHAGVHDVRTPEDLFMEITNYSLEGEGKVFATQVNRYDKEEYAFDYYFEQSEEQRSKGLVISDDSEESEEEEEEEENTSQENIAARLQPGDGEKGEASITQTDGKKDETASSRNNIMGQTQGASSAEKTNPNEEGSSSSSRWVVDCSDCS